MNFKYFRTLLKNLRKFLHVFLVYATFPSAAFASLAPEDSAFWKAYVVYAPYPQYPMAVVRSGAHGNGLFLLKLNSKTGLVDEIKVLKSIRDGRLNAETIVTLMKWRFRPGTIAAVKVPISFQLSGSVRQVH